MFLSDDDDECKMSGCDDAVLLGDAFQPRALRCVPWARDLDNGGCSMDDTCISSRRPSASGEPAGICCRGKPQKKIVNVQVQVAAQKQQQAQLVAKQQQAQLVVKQQQAQLAAKQQQAQLVVKQQQAQLAAKQQQAQYVARKRVVVARQQAQARLVARKRAQIQIARKQAIARQRVQLVARKQAQFQIAREQAIARQQVEMANKQAQIQLVQSMSRPDPRDISMVQVAPRIDYPDDTKVITVVDSSVDDGKLKLSDDSNTYHVVETITVEKAGYCPMDSDIFFNNCDIPAQECFDDNECADDLKCCRSGCGVQFCTIPLPVY